MSLYDVSDIIIDDTNYSWKGDFLGFTIGGIHSSSLGIVRASDGDRYNEELVPTYSDKTATVAGLDETYYFGTDYTQKIFNIKFAFDHLTDLQIKQLRNIFSKKEPQNLIFDEAPYKVYSAKVNGQPKLSYLCFEENYERIYKGDGEVSFIAYSPFARSRYKYLEDYNVKNIPEWGGIEDNKMDWLKSSGIISHTTELGGNYLKGGNLDEYNWQNRIQLYNPGDKDAPCQLLCSTANFSNDDNYGLSKKFPIIALIKNKLTSFNWSNVKVDTLGYIALDEEKLHQKDIKSVLIDSRKRLIYGSLTDITPDTTFNEFLSRANLQICNDCIYSGDFFNIPVVTKEDSLLIGFLNPTNNGEDSILLIHYDYLYY